MIHTAGGRFRRDEPPIYFVASGPSTTEETLGFSPYVLIAVNEVKARVNRDRLARILDADVCVMLDSGIFNLASTHARAHRMPLHEAIAMPPEQVDGFDELMNTYREIVTEFSEQLWGYVELDLGGRDIKRQTRAMLESEGMKPIPVYHPWTDGWDYFDELAERYDRICVSNLVNASPADRARLLAMVWERRVTKYPKLWIHALGVTPNAILLAFPTQSCDSSTWSGHTRWGRFHETSMLRIVGDLDNGLRAGRASTHADTHADTATQRMDAMRVAATSARILGETWRESLAALGAHDPTNYPPVRRHHDTR